jgi:PAS domain-containing protein
LAAGLGSIAALAVARAARPEDLSPLQGNFIAQCCTALLVGASANWVRVRESRYRHVVSHVPLVLYSVSLPRPIAAAPPAARHAPALGPEIRAEATVSLVSEAARQVFGCAPDALVGPYTDWLARIIPADREVVIAALAQLGLQTRPVTCEYRILAANASARAGEPPTRWVRDSMTPHYREDGLLDGWEGFVEDISEYHALSKNLRRVTGMLQALVTNLPMGVYFVQGLNGVPLLVNARARQLLGQREDLAAGVGHLSEVYRLHRPDGSLYPPDELPVSRALLEGMNFTANDVVVHRPDGRKIALMTWAAPIYLEGSNQPDAAVWLLEDLAAVRLADTGRGDPDAVPRALLNRLGVAALLQDADGVVLDCNTAACTLLSMSREELVGSRWPAPDATNHRAGQAQAHTIPLAPSGSRHEGTKVRMLTFLTPADPAR